MSIQANLRPLRHRENSLPPLVCGLTSSAPLVDRLAGKNPHSISIHSGFGNIDPNRISDLIKSSFCGRSLVAGYFDSPVVAVVLEDNYKGLAVVKKLGPKGLYYLDKIATDPSMHGTGLGSALFQAVCNITGDSVSWRAAKLNPANSWYSRLGMQVETDNWYVYLRNVAPSDTGYVIDTVLNLPHTVI